MKYLLYLVSIILIMAGLAGYWFDKDLWGFPLLFGIICLPAAQE